MDTSLIITLLFYVLVVSLVVINRKKFKVESKILFLYRTKKGTELMKRLSKSKLQKCIWTILSTVFILFAVYFAFVGMSALIENAIKIISRETTVAGASLILPGVKVPGGPFLPLFSGVISIIFLAVVHEFSHGVVAFARNIKIKNAGFGFLLPLPIPLAFVEPDEKKIQKARVIDRLRVYASGSGMNILFAIFFMTLGAFYSVYLFNSPAIAPSGVDIFGVRDGALYEYGVPTSATIYSMNGVEVKDMLSFSNFMNNTVPGQNVLLETSAGEFEITLGEEEGNELGVLGGEFRQSYSANNFWGNILISLYNLIFWLGLLNFAIGLINFLPVLWITDGCKMVHDFLSYFTKKEDVQAILTNIIVGFCTLILVINIIGPFIAGLF